MSLQAIFQRLSEEDYILEDTIEQLFSEALGKFLADRFVLGTCPKCKYEVGPPNGASPSVLENPEPHLLRTNMHQSPSHSIAPTLISTAWPPNATVS